MKSSTPQQNKSILLRYREYLKSHTDPFSDSMVQLTQEKIEEIETRKRNS